MYTASQNLLANMIDEDTEILTILYGEETTQSELDKLIEIVSSQYEDIEIEVHAGKQPLYNFIFSVE